MDITATQYVCLYKHLIRFIAPFLTAFAIQIHLFLDAPTVLELRRAPQCHSRNKPIGVSTPLDNINGVDANLIGSTDCRETVDVNR